MQSTSGSFHSGMRVRVQTHFMLDKARYIVVLYLVLHSVRLSEVAPDGS